MLRKMNFNSRLNYSNSTDITEEKSIRILYDIDLTQCRLCQENDGNIAFEKNQDLCDRIKNCTKINLEDQDENLPKSICDSCHELLGNFRIFQENCQHINEQLKNLLVKNARKSVHFNTKNEPIDEFIVLKFDESVNGAQGSSLGDTKPEILEDDDDDAPISVLYHNEESIVYDNDVNYEEEHLDYSDFENSKSGDEDYTKKQQWYYFCPECNKFYTEKRSLKRHVISAHPETPDVWKDVKACKTTSCSACAKRFRDKNELKTHVLAEHPDTPNIWESELDYSDLENWKSDEDKKDLRHYICPECSKFYTERRSLKRHVVSAHPEAPDIWKNVKAFKTCSCIACGKPFRDKVELKAHVLAEHPDQPNIWHQSEGRDGDECRTRSSNNYSCSACGNFYTELRSLKRHVTRKHPDKPEIWKEAKIALNTKWKRDESEASFMCSKCGNTYSYFRSLRRHSIKHHGTKLSASDKEILRVKTENDATAPEDLDPAERKLYECNLCRKIFTEKRSLKRHIWKIHPDTDDIQQTPDGKNGLKYRCTVENCNAAFSTKEHFQRHRYKEHDVKEYLCPKCGKRFRDIKNLHSHEAYHLDVMPYKCPKCEMRFRHPTNLKVHVRNHHEGHRYYCTKCGRAFLTDCTRKRHELIHTGIKDFKCDQCPSEFYTVKELKCHKKYHSNIRPHFCEICYKTFVAKTVLRVHMRTHTGERPYKCDVNGCSKSFAEKPKLYRHKRNIHHVDPFTGEMI